MSLDLDYVKLPYLFGKVSPDMGEHDIIPFLFHDIKIYAILPDYHGSDNDTLCNALYGVPMGSYDAYSFAVRFHDFLDKYSPKKLGYRDWHYYRRSISRTFEQLLSKPEYLSLFTREFAGSPFSMSHDSIELLTYNLWESNSFKYTHTSVESQSDSRIRMRFLIETLVASGSDIILLQEVNFELFKSEVKYTALDTKYKFHYSSDFNVNLDRGLVTCIPISIGSPTCFYSSCSSDWKSETSIKQIMGMGIGDVYIINAHVTPENYSCHADIQSLIEVMVISSRFKYVIGGGDFNIPNRIGSPVMVESAGYLSTSLYMDVLMTRPDLVIYRPSKTAVHIKSSNALRPDIVFSNLRVLRKTVSGGIHLPDKSSDLFKEDIEGPRYGLKRSPFYSSDHLMVRSTFEYIRKS